MLKELYKTNNINSRSTLIGLAKTNFENKSVAVKMYLLPSSVSVYGPIRSIPRTSQVPSVLMGCSAGAILFIFSMC